jgi:predicted lipoprotein with Yx(FWY)xxD motif
MRTKTPAILALSLLTVALAACDKDKYDEQAATEPTPVPVTEPAPPAEAAPVSEPASNTVDRFAIAGQGDKTYLTDSKGRRLYVLEGDEGGTKCIGDCLTKWRVVTGPVPTPDTPDISVASLGTITRSDGTTQVTYYGRPLYYYDDGTPELDPVTVTAESPYGTWYLVNAKGETVVLKEGVPTTTSPTAAGADARDLPTQSPGGKPGEKN